MEPRTVVLQKERLLHLEGFAFIHLVQSSHLEIRSKEHWALEIVRLMIVWSLRKFKQTIFRIEIEGLSEEVRAVRLLVNKVYTKLIDKVKQDGRDSTSLKNSNFKRKKRGGPLGGNYFSKKRTIVMANQDYTPRVNMVPDESEEKLNCVRRNRKR